MATITYIEFSGAQHQLDIATGQSVMQGAVDNNVRGILADCSGACSCATCHVYVDASWLDKVGPRSEFEDLLLEEVCEPRENSRLSCQIKVSDELDGLVVHLPEKQV
jgi:2Fe-2S ferredoxin